MKWFKHSSKFSDSSVIENVERYYGLPGYARYVKLHEIIALRMDSSNQCQMTVTWPQLENMLAGKRKSLSEFLTFLEKHKVIRIAANEQQVSIELPDLLKLRDNHTRNLQVAEKPTCKSTGKSAPGSPVLFVNQEQWQQWLTSELCFTSRQINIPDHCRIMRQWLASNVTTDEIEQAVDRAVLEGIDIKQLASLHKLVAQNRKQRIEEARK